MSKPRNKSQQRSKAIKTQAVWSRKGTASKSKRLTTAKRTLRASQSKSRFTTSR